MIILNMMTRMMVGLMDTSWVRWGRGRNTDLIMMIIVVVMIIVMLMMTVMVMLIVMVMTIMMLTMVMVMMRMMMVGLTDSGYVRHRRGRNTDLGGKLAPVCHSILLLQLEGGK